MASLEAKGKWGCIRHSKIRPSAADVSASWYTHMRSVVCSSLISAISWHTTAQSLFVNISELTNILKIIFLTNKLEIATFSTSPILWLLLSVHKPPIPFHYLYIQGHGNL